MRRSLRNIILIASIALVTAIVAAIAVHEGLERYQRKSAIRWFEQNAIRLKGVQPGSAFDDLEPLAAVIGDARVLGVGEATHGTSEFFRLKHRLFEYAVVRLGFTVFAIEASMPEAFDVNDYVLTGNGDGRKALAGLYFWTCNTAEVLDLVDWMRQYNADSRHSRKVKFYGIDMQFAPRAVRNVLDYLRHVDPDAAGSAGVSLSFLEEPYSARNYVRLSAADRSAYERSVQNVAERLDLNRDLYVARSGSHEWTIARQHARILEQFVKYRRNPQDFGSTFAARDHAMAENVRWILSVEGPDTRVMVWAHNLHVSAEKKTLGGYLRAALGKSYVNFALLLNDGTFQARRNSDSRTTSLTTFKIPAGPKESFDQTLADAGLVTAAIDLRTAPRSGAAASWFNRPHQSRSLGASYNPQFQYEQTIKRGQYDGIMFVAHTTTARAITWGEQNTFEVLSTSVNLDFEVEGRNGAPYGWQLPPNFAAYDWRIGLSSGQQMRGSRCLAISRKAGRHYGGAEFGSASQTIDARVYRGKRVQLRIWARVAAGAHGRAYASMRVHRNVDPPSDLLAEDNMTNRPITSPDWTQYTIELPVAQNADMIDYAVAFSGDGRAYFDGITIVAVGDARKLR